MLVNYENRYPVLAWKSIKSFHNFALTVTRQSPLMRWLIVIHVSQWHPDFIEIVQLASRTTCS